MNLFDWLSKLSTAAPILRDFLQKRVNAGGDDAALAQQLLDELSTAVDAANLANVAAALPGELANLAQGKLDPKDHPSDRI